MAAGQVAAFLLEVGEQAMALLGEPAKVGSG
jgi:hypothetical protein